MGVTTTNNKPFNPRGNDQSPKGYNRAALYSGKALDFDGVNDRLDGGSIDALGTGDFSYSVYFNPDGFSSYHGLFAIGTIYNFGLLTHQTTGQVYAYSTTTGDINSGYFLKDGEWQHITFVKSGTSHKFYINGKLFSDITDTEFSVSAGNYKIGQITSYFANGQYSNARLFNTALTAAQVADLYNNPEKVVPTGVADSALKLWLPMMEGAGTTAINGAPDALGSELITNGDFATDSNWTKGTGTTISGGKANFSNSTDLGIYQGIGTQSGKVQVSFNVSNYSSGTLNVYSGGNQASATINVQADSNGFYSCYVERGGGNINIIFGSTDSFTGSIDDVSVKEVSGYGTINGATWTHGIGAPVSQTSVIDWNKRYFENVANVLIPQGLTSGRDLLGNLFENVRKQGALNLDGNSWGKVHPNNSFSFGTGAFSMEAWVKLEYVNTGSYANEIITLNDSDDFSIKTISTGMSFAVGSGVSLSHTITLDNSWAHIVGVRNADGSMKLYINAVEEESNAAGSSTASVPIDNPVRLGTDSNEASRTYKDQIAQPRIYNRALTAEEVQRNYNAGKNTYTN